MKRGNLMMLCGAFLLAAACLLLAYNMYQSDTAGAQATQLLEDYGQALTTDFIDAPESRVEAIAGDMPALTVDGYPVAGAIAIDAIHVTLPVLDGWSYPMLRVSACKYGGTAQDGGLIILAHNYDTHFGRLKELQPGDSVQFTDVNGIEYEYRVKKLETLGKYDLDRLTDGDWDLTLFTCTYGGGKRVVVRCSSIFG